MKTHRCPFCALSYCTHYLGKEMRFECKTLCIKSASHRIRALKRFTVSQLRNVINYPHMQKTVVNAARFEISQRKRLMKRELKRANKP